MAMRAISCKSEGAHQEVIGHVAEHLLLLRCGELRQLHRLPQRLQRVHLLLPQQPVLAQHLGMWTAEAISEKQ